MQPGAVPARHAAAFCADLEDLQGWCANHPDGVVLMVSHGGNDAPLTMHRAWCDHLGPHHPGAPMLWAWACFESEPDLLAWAGAYLVLSPRGCAACGTGTTPRPPLVSARGA